MAMMMFKCFVEMSHNYDAVNCLSVYAYKLKTAVTMFATE